MRLRFAVLLLALAPGAADAAGISYFRVSKGVDQRFQPPIPTTYVKITWPKVEYDTTKTFKTETGSFACPAAGLLMTGWQVLVSGNASVNPTADPLFVTKLMKNGKSDTAGVGAFGSFPRTSTQAGTMGIPCAAGDIFTLETWIAPDRVDAEVQIDGRFEHTWWWGVFTPADQLAQ